MSSSNLGWPAWYECLRQIHRALAAGGTAIIETPNPGNLVTAANRFYLDPTHSHPIPDALLAFAAKSVGFSSVEILPLHPVVDSEPVDSESSILPLLNGPRKTTRSSSANDAARSCPRRAGSVRKRRSGKSECGAWCKPSGARVPDVEVDLVQLPMKHYPEERLITEMMTWRLIDITEVNGNKVDLVIATKFPSYAVRHPNKVLWLVHQYRQAYDLAGTAYDQSQLTELEQAARNKLRNLDKKFIGECVGRFAISETVSERLLRYNQLLSVRCGRRRCCRNEFTVDLIEHRDLFWPSGREQARVAAARRREPCERGANSDLRRRTRRGAAASSDPAPRTGESLPPLPVMSRRRARRCPRRSARGLLWSLRRDYGYATIEAFLAEKPVITCGDSGEVSRIVARTGGGMGCRTETSLRLPLRCGEVYRHDERQLSALGRAGAAFARALSWRNVVDQLVTPYL